MLMNHNAGFEYVKKLVNLKFKINMVTPYNKGRHLLIQCMNDKDQYIYFYCLFKHTTFHSFNYVFKEFVNSNPDFEGHGESINVEFLEYARKREAMLLYIYPDGKIYSIESNLVFNFCNMHSLTREQDRQNEYLVEYGNGVKTVVREREYVFPIKLMCRFY